MAIKNAFPGLYTNSSSKKCAAIPLTELTRVSKIRIPRNWRIDAIRKETTRRKRTVGKIAWLIVTREPIGNIFCIPRMRLLISGTKAKAIIIRDGSHDIMT
jgi:hypothetical protein